MYLIYILADRRVGAHSGAQEAPIRTFIENGNLSLTRKFGFDVSVLPSSRTLVQTLRAGIKTQWVMVLGKGVSDMYVAFLFGGNQRSCSSKNIG